MKYLVISLLLKGWSRTKNFYPCHALMTPLPVIASTTEGIGGCTTEAAKDANKSPINLPSCFFYFMFYCFSSLIN